LKLDALSPAAIPDAVNRNGLALLLAWLAMLLPCSGIASGATGQSAPPAYDLPRTEVIPIHSKITGQDYRIYVALPGSYADNSTRAYPALFTLDADYSFAIARNIVEHLGDRRRIRETLVFGIAYANRDAYRANRTRDYTPTFVAEGGYGPQFQKLSGGAPKFRAFIARELMPLLEARYRLTRERAIVGHSFGGLFVAWCLMEQPDLFSGHIGVSPSLWYDNGLLLDRKRMSFAASGLRDVRAYFAVGALETGSGGRHPMVAQLAQWTTSLGNAGLVAPRMKTQVLAGENHDTVFPAALTRGLLHLFAPPRPQP
jgi:predicted alpha/beta superfamily hydrolase